MTRWFIILAVGLLAAVTALALSAAAPPPEMSIERVSVSSMGEQANKGAGLTPAISDDGRFVAFNSYASNLVPGDTNGTADVFLRDRKTGKTERVSVNSQGEQANQSSGLCTIPMNRCISADGRVVAFGSEATNLVPGDTNGVGDVFVRDCRAGRTERVSLTPSGGQFDRQSFVMDITPDGRFVLFEGQMSEPGHSSSKYLWSSVQLYVRDRRRGTTEQITSRCADYTVCTTGSISRDGRFVAFTGFLTNTYPWEKRVWLLDRKTGQRERVSADTEVVGRRKHRKFGGPLVSDDGRFVAFAALDGPELAPELSPERLGFGRDVFLWDRETRTAEAINVGPGGEEANGESMFTGMTREGRFVMFSSRASNLVPGDTNDTEDLFLRDRLLGTTTRVSVTPDGTQGNGWSWCGAITPDGRFIAFASKASNFVPGDTNEAYDIFVIDRGPAAK